MHRNILAAALLLIFTTELFSQSDVTQSAWQTRQVVVDGNDNEWEKPFNLYDGSTGLMFSICNDSSNLFLCFIGNDEMKMRKMMRAGWEIELSSKEKNKKFSASISFPVRQMAGSENKDGGNTSRHKWSGVPGASGGLKNLVSLYKLQFINIKTTGFKTKNGQLPSIDENGIKIDLGEDSLQGVIFEIAIPLVELIDKNILQLNEQLTLNVTVNAMESPASGKGEHEGGGGGGWGGGQGRMGGGQGRMGGVNDGGMMGGQDRMNDGEGTDEGFSGSSNRSMGGMEARNTLFDKASFKQKFKLAKP